MKTHTLGRNLQVSAIGLGCMGMSQSFPPTPKREDRDGSDRRSRGRGMTLFDTAQVNGPFDSEEMVGQTVEPVRDRAGPRPGSASSSRRARTAASRPPETRRGSWRSRTTRSIHPRSARLVHGHRLHRHRRTSPTAGSGGSALHTGRPHRLAHAPPRPDDLGDRGCRSRPEGGRDDRNDPPRRSRVLRACLAHKHWRPPWRRSANASPS